MRDYLLFRLHGAMAAWGDVAVGQVRPSFAHPSKSAVMGMLAAALGIRREEEDGHHALSAGYGFAVRLDAQGSILRDYHTAQVPPERRGVTHHTRRDELCASDLNTILSSRDYYCDALYTVGLWEKGDPPHALADLRDALRKPQFTLYLGRKACPLSLPLRPMVVSAGTLREAFAKARFGDDEILAEIPRAEIVAFHWEELVDSGLLVRATTVRRDQVLSRHRWQYAEREESAGIDPAVLDAGNGPTEKTSD